MHHFFTIARATVLAMSVTLAASARADGDPQAFVRTEHDHLVELLKQPVSPARDEKVAKMLDHAIDYGEMVRRSFGQPCPVSGCTDHWATLDEGQKTTISDLLRKLIERNYKKNVAKTLDYDINYKGASAVGNDTKVRTEAKSKTKVRDPAVFIDYVVRPQNSGFRIVDIIPEGSSITTNYYNTFHKMLTTPDQGFPYVVKKLTEKLSKVEEETTKTP